jgi:acetoin utilization deacetylase AcuC-like enzyme
VANSGTGSSRIRFGVYLSSVRAPVLSLSGGGYDEQRAVSTTYISTSGLASAEWLEAQIFAAVQRLLSTMPVEQLESILFRRQLEDL